MVHKKEKVFSRVSTILQVGSLCAGGLLVIGLGIFFFQPHIESPKVGSLPPAFSDFVHSIFRGEANAIINLGILVMMFTPFLRVVVAGFSFLSERDFKYTIISFGVMVILLFTILPIFV